MRPDEIGPGDFPVVFGRYTLLGLLGEGGMARVFRAELQGPEGFRKPAALKVIHASVATRNERLRLSLIREARMGGLLQHPNIVETYEFGVQDDLPFIAMEWIRGVGLDQLLHLMRPLPAQVALEICAQICAGLAHAHDLAEDGRELGVVHRDLKPSNVILSREGIVKVMDFGIAKATSMDTGLTDSGMTKGTPAYMSPEQAAGEPLDRRSDLFALGALLFEMVCGRRLFDGESITAVLMRVVTVEDLIANPETLAPLDRAVPGLAAVVYSCLRKEPGQRLETAGELEQELRELMASAPPAPALRQIVRDAMLARGDDPTTLPPPTRTPGTRTAEGARPQTPGAPLPLLKVPAQEPSVEAGAGPGEVVGPTRHISISPRARSEGPAEPDGVEFDEAPTDPHAARIDDAALGDHEAGEIPPAAESRRPARAIAPAILAGGVLLLILGAWLVLRPGPPPPAPAPEPATPNRMSRGEGPPSLPPAPAAPEADVTPPVAPPEPTVGPTPTPRREPRRQHSAEKPVVARPPPTPTPTPAATVPSPGRGLASRVVSRGTDGLRVEFRATLSVPEDTRVTFWLNPKRSSWVSQPMRRLSDGTWVSPVVVFPPQTWGNAYAYIEVAGSAQGPAFGLGTRSDPIRIRVE